MKITKHKGQPRIQLDWSELDSAVEKLNHGHHLRVRPNGHESVKRLAQKINLRYHGVTARARRAYVTIILNEATD